MATTVLSENDIRIFMMDKAELNPLLQGVRWSTEDIDRACIMVIDAFNMQAPSVSPLYSVEDFPHRYLLLMGVCGYLLRSAAINEASNQLDYNTEGVSVQDRNKAPIFTQLGNQYWEEFREQTQSLKLRLNVSACYGSMRSDFPTKIN